MTIFCKMKLTKQEKIGSEWVTVATLELAMTRVAYDRLMVSDPTFVSMGAKDTRHTAIVTGVGEVCVKMFDTLGNARSVREFYDFQQ